MVAQTLAPPPEPLAPRHVEVVLNGEVRLSKDVGSALALSPNGQILIYRVGVPGMGITEPFHIRSLNDLTDKQIPGTADGYHPFFSPDGQSLGFVTRSELKIASLSGGQPQHSDHFVSESRRLVGERWDHRFCPESSQRATEDSRDRRPASSAHQIGDRRTFPSLAPVFTRWPACSVYGSSGQQRR